MTTAPSEIRNATGIEPWFGARSGTIGASATRVLGGLAATDAHSDEGIAESRPAAAERSRNSLLFIGFSFPPNGPIAVGDCSCRRSTGDTRGLRKGFGPEKKLLRAGRLRFSGNEPALLEERLDDRV